MVLRFYSGVQGNLCVAGVQTEAYSVQDKHHNPCPLSLAPPYVYFLTSHPFVDLAESRESHTCLVVFTYT